MTNIINIYKLKLEFWDGARVALSALLRASGTSWLWEPSSMMVLGSVLGGSDLEILPNKDYHF